MGISIGTYETDCFSFHQSFEDTPGVRGREMQVLEGVCFFGVSSYA